MKLIDDDAMVEPLIFSALAAEFGDTLAFDWDTVWTAASEPVEPWQWKWRTPLRALQQQLIGTSDVTGWTEAAGQQLAAVLREPTTMHRSLLDLRAAETGVGLLPAVTGAPDTVTVRAAGDELGLLPRL